MDQPGSSTMFQGSLLALQSNLLPTSTFVFTWSLFPHSGSYKYQSFHWLPACLPLFTPSIFVFLYLGHLCSLLRYIHNFHRRSFEVLFPCMCVTDCRVFSS